MNDDIEIPDKVKERLTELFNPKSLWDTVKKEYHMFLIWIAFFLIGFWLAGIYYDTALQNNIQQHCTEICNYCTQRLSEAPSLSWVDGTIFGK